jgi:hypothetical protein
MRSSAWREMPTPRLLKNHTVNEQLNFIRTKTRMMMPLKIALKRSQLPIPLSAIQKSEPATTNSVMPAMAAAALLQAFPPAEKYFQTFLICLAVVRAITSKNPTSACGYVPGLAF